MYNICMPKVVCYCKYTVAHFVCLSNHSQLSGKNRLTCSLSSPSSGLSAGLSLLTEGGFVATTGPSGADGRSGPDCPVKYLPTCVKTIMIIPHNKYCRVK